MTQPITSQQPVHQVHRGVGVFRLLDPSLAALIVFVLVLYLALPHARHALLVMLFIPVCISAFYVSIWRAVVVAGATGLIVTLSTTSGWTPDWAQALSGDLFTLVAWAISLACCSVCISGISRMQAQAIVRLQESHIVERMIDGLTGALNRLGFEHELSRLVGEAQSRTKRLAALVVDVDYFKQFNDRYGHQAGDFVLIEVAKVLRNSVRDHDVVARYGGEEFVILLPESERTSACRAAERIRKSIERTRFRHEGNILRLTVSVGAAELQHDESGRQLVDRADAALYASKQTGRNCVHFHDGTELVPFGTSHVKYSQTDSSEFDLDTIADDGYFEQVTGLPHRRIFHEELKRRVAEAHRYQRDLAVFVIRFDDYGDVTRMGMEAEAKLLAVLAETLRGCLRDCDLGGRIERIEFAALLPETGLVGAQVPAQRFIKGLVESRKSMFRGIELTANAHIGIAYLAPREEADSFVRRARDAAAEAVSRKETLRLAGPPCGESAESMPV